MLYRLTDTENKLVTSGEGSGKCKIGVGKIKVIMGLYEMMCLKLLQTVMLYRI